MKGKQRMSSRAGSLSFRVALAVAVTAVVVISAPQGMTWLGRWLVVEDPLERAHAIAVLGGHMPFRAMEAAAVYHQGWTGEIWLTRGVPPEEDLALASLRIKVPGEEVYNREILEQLGVPPDAIRLLPGNVLNTVEEVRLIVRELRGAGGDRVILVTSKPHTRRVRATWRSLFGDSPRAVVRYARQDPYDPDMWWHRTVDALAVSREVFGLMNVWTGFPVKPESR